jgi:hypothetical protein
MKTNYWQVQKDVSFYRRNIKTTVQDFLYGKFIAWSIEHLILPGFKIEVTDNVIITPYNPKFQPSVDLWDKQLAKLAKWFDKEPEKNITKEKMEAHFFECIHTGIYSARWRGAVYVYLKSNNTEACEVTTEQVLVERTKLTGYCAALAEKRYLQPA